MTKNERLQALIYRYKQETGEKAVDMERIADWRSVREPYSQSPRPRANCSQLSWPTQHVPSIASIPRRACLIARIMLCATGRAMASS